MNTKKIAVASTIGAFAIVALLVAYPAMASSAVAPGSPNLKLLIQNQQAGTLQRIQLSPGQTITLTGVAGGYWTVGDRAANGTATGTMTLQVTGSLAGGYTLTVSGGSLGINGTTYTITGGSAELGPYGARAVGQGEAGTSQFLFTVRDLGRFGSTNFGVLRVDLKDGQSEFVARLLVTVTA